MYQRKFRKDVFVDLNCYRKWGHNELDDPLFTNPIIYKIIQNRLLVPNRYVEKLVMDNVLSTEKVKNIIGNHSAQLNQVLNAADNYILQPAYSTGLWSKMQQAVPSITQWDTGVDLKLLQFIAEKSVHIENDSSIHPKLMESHVHPRLNKVVNSEQLDGGEI